MTSLLVTASPLLARAGAVPAEGPDASVAWHYGDPTAEQRALESGSAVVDQSHLGVVTVTGPDRLTWLNSLSSQEVASLAPGVSTELMILNPQGRIEHVAGAVDDGETAWLITETAAGLAAHLDRMRFMLRVEVADATADWAAIGEPSSAPTQASAPAPTQASAPAPTQASAPAPTQASAPAPTQASAPAGAAGAHPTVTHPAVTWVDPWPHIGSGGTTYAPAGAAPGEARPWRLVLVPRGDLAAEVESRIAAGATLAGTWATEALRIAAHRPRAATEVDETSLPHELDWLRTAVHLHKGCYRGQETVAKVHNVGRPPRRLTLLHLDGSGADLPALGAAVTLPGSDAAVGRVTSVSRHHELGPIALAVLKRSTDPSATLMVVGEDGPIDASQEIIVNADGFSADRPPKPGPTTKGLLMGKGCAADGGDIE